MSTYLIENFVNTKPGEAIRLFPFGKLVKNGNVREITPELAAQFRLPHFMPPIKMGSHEDTTPAGGHIARLEVRTDGLYGVPEYTDKGAQVLLDGSYRYHSPEVIWGDGALENPLDGSLIQGPLIVGLALLHTPHLGERAALYSIEPKEGVIQMTNETVTMPVSWLEKLFSGGGRNNDAQPPAVDSAPSQPEDYTALAKQRDDLAAQIATMQAEQAQLARVAQFTTELKPTKLAELKEAPQMLASMTDAQAAWVVTQFSALSAQIDESKLTGDVGNSTNDPTDIDPVTSLTAIVQTRAATDGTDFNTAFKVVAQEQPELVAAYNATVYGGK